jgi:hypothetical protein
MGGLGLFFLLFNGAGVDRAFRPVEQKVTVGGGECHESLGIGGEGLAHAGGRRGAMIAQRGELILKGRLIHCRTPKPRAIITDRMFPARVVATIY